MTLDHSLLVTQFKYHYRRQSRLTYEDRNQAFMPAAIAAAQALQLDPPFTKDQTVAMLAAAKQIDHE